MTPVSITLFVYTKEKVELDLRIDFTFWSVIWGGFNSNGS